MKKKILIVYASYGSGHKAIAKYIEDYFYKEDEELEIKSIDILDYATPIIGSISQKLNSYFMLKIPILHALTYNMFDYKITGAIADNVSMNLFKNKRMNNFIKNYNPDLTIATHFFGSSLITYCNKKGYTNSKLITVVTDYEAHELWMNDYKTDDYIVVGAKEEVPQLVKRGIDKKKIKPIGIPIMPKMSTKFDKNKILNRFHLSGLRPICIFFGGGGNGSLASLPFAKKVFKSNHNIDFIFIAGKNKKSKVKIDKFIREYRIKNVKTLGFVDNVPELLQTADFVVSKPGGGQTTECLYFNKPVLMINSSGGQEKANYKLFTKNGYGKWFRTPWGLNNYIKEIAKKPTILNRMVHNMEKIDNTQSMKKLYELSSKLLEK